MCQNYEENLRTTCEGARQFDRWELALCQHPMLLLVKEDDTCAEREAAWGGDIVEGYRRLDHNLDLVQEHPSLRLCYDFAVVELEMVKEERPDLYEKFKRNFRDKKITFVNGTYSQPHLASLGAESCYRQIEEGCRSMKEMFGKSPRTYASQEPCYIEQLPQILKAFKYDYITLSHFAWSLKFLTPHELLGYRGRLHYLEGDEFTNWLAPDGTAMPLYLADVGGPLHGFLKDQGIYWEYHKDLFRAPTLRIGYPDLIDLPEGWLEANEKNGRTVLIDNSLDERIKKYPPESSARLIPTFTYTAEGIDGSRLNVLNRRAETLLNQLRAIEAILGIEKIEEVRSYRHIWKIILKAQHHDGYWPGGPGLRKKAEGWLMNLNNEMSKRIKNRMKALCANVSGTGRRMLTVNTIPAKTAGLVRTNVPSNKEHTLLSTKGNSLPSQIVPVPGNEAAHEILAIVKIDGLGYETYEICEGKRELTSKEMTKPVSFKNEYYSCKANPDLTFSSLVFSKTGEQLLKKGAAGNEWKGLALNGRWMTTRECWNGSKIYDGHLGKVITASYAFPKAKMAVRALLIKDLPWIEFEAVLDADGFSVGDYWKNISKLCITWSLASADAIRHEVPFSSNEGRQRRPLVASRWVDIHIGKSAFAYFNGGMPAHFVEDGVLRNVIAWGAETDNFNSRIYGSMKYSKVFDLSLRGRYHYRWAVMPHSPKMTSCELSNLAHSWSEPPLGIIEESSKGKMPSEKTYLSLQKNLVPVCVEKDVEDTGDLKVLFYETDGKEARITTKKPSKMRSEIRLLDLSKANKLGPHKIGWLKVKLEK
jgi:hypothetical protein